MLLAAKAYSRNSTKKDWTSGNDFVF
jgi:hypothetical protein